MKEIISFDRKDVNPHRMFLITKMFILKTLFPLGTTVKFDRLYFGPETPKTRFFMACTPCY